MNTYLRGPPARDHAGRNRVLPPPMPQEPMVAVRVLELGPHLEDASEKALSMRIQPMNHPFSPGTSDSGFRYGEALTYVPQLGQHAPGTNRR
eukprot:8029278-Pyramimonas_sp.AAC.1